MLGLMMDTPLLVSALLRHAAVAHGEVEVVSREADGRQHRQSYRELERRCRRLANALGALGVQPGDRVATLAWNGHRHLEAIYAVAGMGAVCHTVNPRLFLEQIVYIINHADDRVVCFDGTLAPLVAELMPRCAGVRDWVLLADDDQAAAGLPRPVRVYEPLLAAATDDFDWPDLDEREACGLCYTSGTTGNPKGVLYSHRSSVLHALAAALPDAVSVSALDVVMPISPMFHVMAWGIPHYAPCMGAKLVLPGPKLDPESLYTLFEQEGVTVTAAVPTVWFGLLAWMRERKLRFGTLQRALIGGSACPRSVIDALQGEFGVQVVHGWGMTETSPIATTGRIKAKHRALSTNDRHALQTLQGRPLFGMELKVVGPDGLAQPWDGTSFGELLVRGPWVTSGYFRGEGGEVLRDGWFPTGDIATIDADGYVHITDRAKDLVKSGGEWISSIELENTAVAHPGVAEAAAIGVPHPKWTERPLLVVVRKAGATVTREELLAFYQGRVAKWCVPDDVVFVDALPHTATGKLLKASLREQYRGHVWPDPA